MLDTLKVDVMKKFSPPPLCPASRKQNIKKKENLTISPIFPGFVKTADKQM